MTKFITLTHAEGHPVAVRIVMIDSILENAIHLSKPCTLVYTSGKFNVPVKETVAQILQKIEEASSSTEGTIEKEAVSEDVIECVAVPITYIDRKAAELDNKAYMIGITAQERLEAYVQADTLHALRAAFKTVRVPVKSLRPTEQ